MAGIGLFSALDIAISGMFVSQLASQVINHNIANANNPGYSRQMLRIGSKVPLSMTFGSIGRGAQSLGIDRAQNRFLQQQVVDQRSLLGTYDSMDETLRSIEQIMGSMGDDRIGSSLNEFFAAWSDLATPPIDDGKRTSVVQHAQKLTMKFNEIDSALATLQRDTRSTYDSYVTDVNLILDQVASLNGQIVASTSGGQLPHDLIDQRTRYLDQLSDITRFTTVMRNDGTADVIVEGRALVTRGEVNHLRVQEYGMADGSVGRRAVFGGRDPVTVTFESGALSGYEQMTNDTIPKLRADLDALAAQVIDQVNALHQQGITERGRGVALFTGNTAATMAVNSAVINDVRLVATGRSGEAGDNELALEIAQLNTTLQPGQQQTLNERYTQMIVEIATERGTYNSLLMGQQSIVEAAQARLDAEKGVNLDEELANLMMFQRTYEANARVVRVVDEMLDTLVNGMI